MRVPEDVRHDRGEVAPFATGVRAEGHAGVVRPSVRRAQNDLDLIVRAANGDERHGNMGTSKRFDRSNNVEQVVWDSIPPGDADIVIRALRITSLPQPYAYAGGSAEATA